MSYVYEFARSLTAALSAPAALLHDLRVVIDGALKNIALSGAADDDPRVLRLVQLDDAVHQLTALDAFMWRGTGTEIDTSDDGEGADALFSWSMGNSTYAGLGLCGSGPHPTAVELEDATTAVSSAAVAATLQFSAAVIDEATVALVRELFGKCHQHSEARHALADLELKLEKHTKAKHRNRMASYSTTVEAARADEQRTGAEARASVAVVEPVVYGTFKRQYARLCEQLLAALNPVENEADGASAASSHNLDASLGRTQANAATDDEDLSLSASVSAAAYTTIATATATGRSTTATTISRASAQQRMAELHGERGGKIDRVLAEISAGHAAASQRSVALTTPNAAVILVPSHRDPESDDDELEASTRSNGSGGGGLVWRSGGVASLSGGKPTASSYVNVLASDSAPHRSIESTHSSKWKHHGASASNTSSETIHHVRADAATAGTRAPSIVLPLTAMGEDGQQVSVVALADLGRGSAVALDALAGQRSPASCDDNNGTAAGSSAAGKAHTSKKKKNTFWRKAQERTEPDNIWFRYHFFDWLKNSTGMVPIAYGLAMDHFQRVARKAGGELPAEMRADIVRAKDSLVGCLAAQRRKQFDTVLRSIFSYRKNLELMRWRLKLVREAEGRVVKYGGYVGSGTPLVSGERRESAVGRAVHWVATVGEDGSLSHITTTTTSGGSGPAATATAAAPAKKPHRKKLLKWEAELASRRTDVEGLKQEVFVEGAGKMFTFYDEMLTVINQTITEFLAVVEAEATTEAVRPRREHRRKPSFGEANELL